MKISCSPNGVIVKERPGQGLQDVADAGFENVFLDMSVYCAAYELEQLGKRMEWMKPERTFFEQKTLEQPIPERKQSVEEMISEFCSDVTGFTKQCKQKQLCFSVAQSPYLLRDTKCVNLNDVLLRLVEESIKGCGKVGCAYLVVRPLFAGVESGKEWEINRNFYLGLAQKARECGVVILLENQCRDLGGHLVRGICAEALEAADWVDELNRAAGEERFGFCMDVAVCNLCGQDMQEFATALGKRLKAVILRDCDGHNESARLPFTCVSGKAPQTDWLSLIRGLREIGFDGQLILDMEDTAAAFSTLLRPTLLTLAKNVADFFAWQIEIESTLKRYDSIVLFGAGNMCRNYMKCYGEKYPPLFTCDNNRGLWGTSFCGLEVRSPEALKDLPAECGVIICNMYYREIEMQLQEMGVKNIAFFSDEYMPSFHFDRLNGA